VEIAAVKYCLQTFGSPLPTGSPPKGEDNAFWSNVRMYKGYANKEALQNQMAALRSEMAALRSEKAELLKKENLLLQQRQQGTATVAQSGSAVLSIEKQGEHRSS
jgi:hypothetical protein